MVAFVTGKSELGCDMHGSVTECQQCSTNREQTFRFSYFRTISVSWKRHRIGGSITGEYEVRIGEGAMAHVAGGARQPLNRRDALPQDRRLETTDEHRKGGGNTRNLIKKKLSLILRDN